MHTRSLVSASAAAASGRSPMGGAPRALGTALGGRRSTMSQSPPGSASPAARLPNSATSAPGKAASRASVDLRTARLARPRSLWQAASMARTQEATSSPRVSCCASGSAPHGSAASRGCAASGSASSCSCAPSRGGAPSSGSTYASTLKLEPLP